MLLNEIKDPNLAATLGRFAKDYGPGGAMAPRPKKSPEELEIAKRKHDMDVAQRENLELALKPIAQKYSGNQLQQFKKEVEKTLSAEQLKGVDLNSMFNLLNPERIAQSEQSWRTFAQQRANNTSGFDD